MSDPATARLIRSPERWWSRQQQLTARLVLLGSLYFAQGLPYGFFTQAVPVLLRKQGASLSKIGFTALLTLPWALKFLWAPLVDRWHWARLGRRRSWILPMQLASTLTLLVLAALPGASRMTPLMIGMAMLNLFAATQDIATDGLAVDILPPHERGLANGLQVAGYRLGMVVGGGVLLAYSPELGLRGVFAAMALLTVLSSVPVLRRREAARPASAAAAADAEARPAGVHFLRLPGVAPILALLFVYKFGESLATGMLRPFLSDHGLSLPEIGWLLGTVGFVAGLLGAMTGGALVTSLGRRRALMLFGGCQALAVSSYAYLAIGHPSHTDFYLACAAEHFASGMATAALFTAMMDWCRPAHAATDYTVQASAVVISTGTAAVLSGTIAQAVGYRDNFLIAAALCVLAIAAAAVLVPRIPFANPPAQPGGMPDRA